MEAGRLDLQKPRDDVDGIHGVYVLLVEDASAVTPPLSGPGTSRPKSYQAGQIKHNRGRMGKPPSNILETVCVSSTSKQDHFVWTTGDSEYGTALGVG